MTLKLKKPPPIKIDPLVRALTPELLQRDIDDFERLLDDSADEPRIHGFLAQHSYFFNGIIRIFGVSPLYSKVRLGNEFEVDFACFDSGSCGPEWRLVEIEGPSQPLFTRSGDLSAKLNHAIRQVQDWQSWIHENLDYARKLLPQIEYPLGYIFMGRRSELTSMTAKRLRRINYDYRHSLEVHSLDWFVSAARSVTNILGDRGRGNWPLRMKALTHKELTRGLPPLARQYMKSFFASPMARLYPDEFLREREWKYAFSGGADGEEVF